MLPAADDDFDVASYVSSPTLDVPSQIALGRQLLAAVPSDLTPQAETCRKQLLTRTRALEDGYQASQVDDLLPLRRPIDECADNSWTCLKTRLDPYTWLSPDRFPEESRCAQDLTRRLFPTGLSFTKVEYGAQWAEASWRINLIAKENLEPDLRRLCGDLFVDELFHWHKEYGKMVGAVATRRGSVDSAAPRPNLSTLRRQAAQAVVAWQMQLVAMHLAGHPGARAALRPTDEYRVKVAAGGGGKTPSGPKGPEAGPGPTPSQPQVAAN